MAKKRDRQTAKQIVALAAAKPAGAKTRAVKIVLDPNEDTPNYYANYAEVSMGAQDLGIAFAQLPTKLSIAKSELAASSGTLLLDPVVQVTLPPPVAVALIKALETMKDQYEKAFGPIAEPKKGPPDA